MKILFKTKTEIYTLFLIALLSSVFIYPIITSISTKVDWDNYTISSIIKRKEETEKKNDLKIKKLEKNKIKKEID